jgi:hypothetical protein
MGRRAAPGDYADGVAGLRHQLRLAADDPLHAAHHRRRGVVDEGDLGRTISAAGLS